MKIAFVSQPRDAVVPPVQNSIGIWTYEVARHLAPLSDVLVYTGGSRLRKYATRDAGVRYRHLPTLPDRQMLRLHEQWSKFRNAKRPFFASNLYYLGYILQVAADLRREQCDIIHAYNYSQFVPILRAFNPTAKIVLHMHCEWLTQLDRKTIKRRLRELDLVLGCSNYITKKIADSFPEFADRCQTIFNAVDIDHFSSANDHNTMHKHDAKKLLFVGRISPEKGLHVLLDAFQQVVKRYPNAQLEIVGPKPQCPLEFIVGLSDDEKLRQLASFYNGDSQDSYFFHLQEWLLSSDIASQVTFAGFVPHMDLINHYHNADILINPSLSEAFGMSLIEAMACQVPVVATRIGGMTEIVEEQKSGLLVEAGNASALAQAILRLLADENLRKSMGEAGRKRVVGVFSWEQIAENLLNQYMNICPGPWRDHCGANAPCPSGAGLVEHGIPCR